MFYPLNKNSLIVLLAALTLTAVSCTKFEPAPTSTDTAPGPQGDQASKEGVTGKSEVAPTLYRSTLEIKENYLNSGKSLLTIRLASPDRLTFDVYVGAIDYSYHSGQGSFRLKHESNLEKPDITVNQIYRSGPYLLVYQPDDEFTSTANMAVFVGYNFKTDLVADTALFDGVKKMTGLSSAATLKQAKAWMINYCGSGEGRSENCYMEEFAASFSDIDSSYTGTPAAK